MTLKRTKVSTAKTTERVNDYDKIWRRAESLIKQPVACRNVSWWIRSCPDFGFLQLYHWWLSVPDLSCWSPPHPTQILSHTEPHPPVHVIQLTNHLTEDTILTFFLFILIGFSFSFRRDSKTEQIKLENSLKK